MPAQEAASHRSPAFINDIAVLSEAALSSSISLSLTRCGSPWWTGLCGSLSVNLWWPVVGFVDFVVDFCWIVVVGGGFCWFVIASCGFFVDFVVNFCWVCGCRWRIWLFFIGLRWPADMVMLCCVFFLICFTLLQTHRVEYFLEHFLWMQTNTEKIYIYFSWNHLHLRIYYNVKCFTSK